MQIARNIIIILMVFLLLIYIYHRIRLVKESALRLPLGQIVEVDGHNMSVYIEGEGEATLVFMSGGGTCCPILDFKSLYSIGVSPQMGWQFFREYRMRAAGRLVHCRCEGG